MPDQVQDTPLGDYRNMSYHSGINTRMNGRLISDTEATSLINVDISIPGTRSKRLEPKNVATLTSVDPGVNGMASYNNAGTIELICVTNGQFWKFDGVTPTQLTASGVTVSTTAPIFWAEGAGKLWGSDGVNPPFVYDGTTVALIGYDVTNILLLHFTDLSTAHLITDYSAVVAWGDGTTSTLTSAVIADGYIQANGGGGFDIIGNHVYPVAATNRTFTVTLHCGAAVYVASGTVDTPVVGLALGVLTPPAALVQTILQAVTITPPSAQAGVAWTGTVFHFTDSNPNDAITAFTAQITWGDGTTASVTSVASVDGQIVSTGGGGYDVLGTHTYAAGAALPFSVVVTCGTYSCNASATIDVPISLFDVTMTMPVAIQGTVLTGAVLLHFTDAHLPAYLITQYSATITWGDGTSAVVRSTASADGQIVVNGGGFDVVGNHTYNTNFTAQTFSVAVTNPLFTRTASTTSFTVPITNGMTFTKQVFLHFTDAVDTDTIADYSALITWGDGTTSTVTSTYAAAGQIVPNNAGGYDVLGTHTYAATLTLQTFSVALTQGTKTYTASAQLDLPTTGLALATFSPPAGEVTVPATVNDLVYFNSRMYWASGDLIYVSDVGDPRTISNEPMAIAEGCGNTILKMMPYREGYVVVFKGSASGQGSIYVVDMSADDPLQAVIYPLFDNLNIVAPKAVAHVGNDLYSDIFFCTTEGIRTLNFTSLDKITYPSLPFTVNISSLWTNLGAAHWDKVHAVVYEDEYLLFVPTLVNGTPNTVPTEVYAYSLKTPKTTAAGSLDPAQGWTEIDTMAGSCACVAGLGGATYLYYGDTANGYIWQAFAQEGTSQYLEISKRITLDQPDSDKTPLKFALTVDGGCSGTINAYLLFEDAEERQIGSFYFDTGGFDIDFSIPFDIGALSIQEQYVDLHWDLQGIQMRRFKDVRVKLTSNDQPIILGWTLRSFIEPWRYGGLNEDDSSLVLAGGLYYDTVVAVDLALGK